MLLEVNPLNTDTSFCSCAFEAYKSADWEEEVARRSSCLPEEQRQQEGLSGSGQNIPGNAFFILKTSALLASGCVSIFWEFSSRFLWRWISRGAEKLATTAAATARNFRQPKDSPTQPDHTVSLLEIFIVAESCENAFFCCSVNLKYTESKKKLR